MAGRSVASMQELCPLLVTVKRAVKCEASAVSIALVGAAQLLKNDQKRPYKQLKHCLETSELQSSEVPKPRPRLAL